MSHLSLLTVQGVRFVIVLCDGFPMFDVSEFFCFLFFCVTGLIAEVLLPVLYL